MLLLVSGCQPHLLRLPLGLEPSLVPLLLLLPLSEPSESLAVAAPSLGSISKGVGGSPSLVRASQGVNSSGTGY